MMIPINAMTTVFTVIIIKFRGRVLEEIIAGNTIPDAINIIDKIIRNTVMDRYILIIVVFHLLI